MNKAIRTHLRRIGLATLVGGVLAGVINAAPKSPTPSNNYQRLAISQVPIFFGAVQPNIFLTLDDSASMAWSFMPDSIFDPGATTSDRDGRRAAWGLSATRNYLAYDPTVVYNAPVFDANGVPVNATFGAAWDDGYAHAAGGTTCPVDLGTSYLPSWGGGSQCDAVTDTAEYHQLAFDASTLLLKPEAAFYYVYDPSAQAAGCAVPDTGTSSCYRRVVVSGAAEQQNFANWYSYYRKRIYTEKAATLFALQSLGPETRVGMGRINQTATTPHTVLQSVGFLTGTHRTNVLNDVLRIAPLAAASPLRRAADDIGQYFRTPGPWYDNLSGSGASLSCRRSYHLLFSDGYWTGGEASEASTAAARTDVDGLVGPTITGTGDEPPTFTYIPKSPFSDLPTTPGYANTLADVAMYYWVHDLQDGTDTPVQSLDLANNVPTTPKDPAFWQHLTTIAVGLGLDDPKNDPDEAFNAILTGSSVSWPPPITDADGKVVAGTLDDFLHAAVDSRGDFLNMKYPGELGEVLAGLVTNIPGGIGSSASAVLNSGSLRSDTRLYQARFNSINWTGQLLAYEIDKDTGLIVDQTKGTPPLATAWLWDAGKLIPSAANRTIWTYDGTAGIEFKSDATTAGKLGLDPNLIAYVRGFSPGDPHPGGVVPTNWRARDSLLGDIVNSAPAYAGPPSYLYPVCGAWAGEGDASAPEDADCSVDSTGEFTSSNTSYEKFREEWRERGDMLYVGANDGMLHGFDATDGGEVFAYAPRSMFSKLSALTNPFYGGDTHRYFVDGSPTFGDAFFDKQWHTVLVSGLGAGGQGVFALDVTNPAAVKVLWEYSDADNKDLGFTFSQPNIVRAGLGGGAPRWYAIFGNGYNNMSLPPDAHESTTGNAVLIAVDVETRAAEVLDTGVGAAASASKSVPNGLSGVAPIDYGDPNNLGSYTADYAYAGDIFGNLWRFDLYGWKFTKIFSANTGGSSPQPQPITTRPSVIRHPLGGVLVLFGTGKYLEATDATATNQITQSFYAVWDKLGANPQVIARSDMLQQKILGEATVTAGGKEVQYRITSDYPISWKTGTNSGSHLGWYMDFVDPVAGSNRGERQVSDSLVRTGRVIFTTLIPAANDCNFNDNTGWLMELDAATGARLGYSPFDVTRNGTFDTQDYLTGSVTNPDGTTTTSKVPVSGRKSTVGIVPTPAVLARPGGEKEYKYLSGSTGELEVVTENTGGGADVGRKTWTQLLRDAWEW